MASPTRNKARASRPAIDPKNVKLLEVGDLLTGVVAHAHSRLNPLPLHTVATALVLIGAEAYLSGAKGKTRDEVKAVVRDLVASCPPDIDGDDPLEFLDALLEEFGEAWDLSAVPSRNGKAPAPVTVDA